MIVVYLILVLILLKIYICIKHPFWNRQPVFHVYNLYYLFFVRGIIYNKLPKIDHKYFDSRIKVFKKNEIDVSDFILKNWNDNKKWKPYIKEQNKIATYEIDNKLAGVICSEFLNYKEKKVSYIDYLCIDKKFRKRNISPKLIYNIFLDIYKNDDIKIFLFKWEHKSMNIIPLCVYDSFYFDQISFKLNEKREFKIIDMDNKSLNILYKNKEVFKVKIICDYDSLCNKIKDKHIKIYGLMNLDELVGLYVFNEYNQCIASINYGSKEEFIYGFKIILNKYKDKLIVIDNISHNTILLSSILKEKLPVNVEKHSYYFYNYIQLPVLSENIIVIN